MKNLIFAAIAAFGLACLSAATPASPERREAGWWCSSVDGQCYADKFGCGDGDACHWRRRAWVTEDYPAGTFHAWETQLMCDRFRRSTSVRTTRCEHLRRWAETP